jgi:hypothetical protein
MVRCRGITVPWYEGMEECSRGRVIRCDVERAGAKRKHPQHWLFLFRSPLAYHSPLLCVSAHILAEISSLTYTRTNFLARSSSPVVTSARGYMDVTPETPYPLYRLTSFPHVAGHCFHCFWMLRLASVFMMESIFSSCSLASEYAVAAVLGVCRRHPSMPCYTPSLAFPWYCSSCAPSLPCHFVPLHVSSTLAVRFTLSNSRTR